MRLLFFPGGTWVWGQELVTLSLMKALRADGHDCRAVISGWNDGHYERLLTEAGVVHHAVKLGRVYISRPAWTLDTLANLSAAAAQVRRIVRDFKPDAVVISALDQATLLSVCLPREIPLVLHAHSTPDRIYRTLLGKLLLRRVACIVAISRFVETELRCSSAQLRNIATVHNGVEVDGAEVPERSRPSGALRIGIVGQILPRKRHGTLIEAAEKMRRAGAAAFEIHVYGDDSGDLAGRLKALVASKGLSDIFRWHGFVSSHREMFGSLDVVVAPSVDEPFGLTVLEAGRFGLPVVAARSLRRLARPRRDSSRTGSRLEWS